MIKRGVSLKEHFERLLAEKDLRDQQRFDAQEKALTAALNADRLAVQAALTAQEKAVTKAEVAADKRFDLINELRVGVATRDEVQALEKIVTVMRDEVTALRGATAGGASARTTLFTIGGLVIAAVSAATIVISFVAR